MDDPEGPRDAGRDRASDDDRDPERDTASPVAHPVEGTTSEPVDRAPTDSEAGERPSPADDEGNVAGVLAPDLPVEPGQLDPVNVLFVVAGGYVGVLTVATFLGAGGRFGPGDYGVITIGYAVLAAAVYLLLARGDPTT